ncbi:hypothetical protein EV715DRAFT_272452 [Schizophyllum commune]
MFRHRPIHTHTVGMRSPQSQDQVNTRWKLRAGQGLRSRRAKEQDACLLTNEGHSRCRNQGCHPFLAYEHASLPTIHEQTSVSQCGEATAPRRDDTFYLEVVTFRVSSTLFRVPRYAFEGGSAVFASMFTLPPGQGQDTEGCSDEHPVVLEGATDEEFRQFLRILLPRNALRPDHDLTQEQWTHVLKLATMWDFDDVRQLAVSKMGKMEMSRDQRFRLGRAYSVSKWYHGVLKDLVQRVEPLTKEDVDLVGIDIALGIASNRERIAPSIYGQWLYEERRKVPSTVYKEGLPCAVEQLVRDFFPLD